MSKFEEQFQGQLPDWKKIYDEIPTEELPWFNPNLDEDLSWALTQFSLHEGAFLDLGTGPGTQAIELAKRGFDVTASDLSESAVAKAKKRGRHHAQVQWLEDDILNSKIKGRYDYVFDRGCFHCLRSEDRPTYVDRLTKLVKISGYAFLKCMSVDELRPDFGPARFSHDDIHRIFADWFNILDIKDTVFQGTLDPMPKALFVSMRAK